MIRINTKLLKAVAAVFALNVMSASAIVVSSFENLPGNTLHHWYVTELTPGGSASIVNAPAGGPLPTGAGLLTSDATNTARAEVATFNNYGLATAVLADAQLSYSYYKTFNGMENSTAPSLKLAIYNPGGTGDNYGQLIYEPYWNTGGTVPANSWQSVSINSTTGAGSDATGGWWWNGGFNIASGAGGPPLRSLAEWLAAFQLADPTDFAGASIVSLSVGIGTFNPHQTDFFDAVRIQTGMFDFTYDFEPQGDVPEGGSALALLGLGLAGIATLRRKLRNA